VRQLLLPLLPCLRQVEHHDILSLLVLLHALLLLRKRCGWQAAAAVDAVSTSPWRTLHLPLVLLLSASVAHCCCCCCWYLWRAQACCIFPGLQLLPPLLEAPGRQGQLLLLLLRELLNGSPELQCCQTGSHIIALQTHRAMQAKQGCDKLRHDRT
jgi:hypothetical protein